MAPWWLMGQTAAKQSALLSACVSGGGSTGLSPESGELLLAGHLVVEVSLATS